jgi:transcriptional regulator with XRE-family HTH domain
VNRAEARRRFPNRIRAAIAERGLTQTEVARLAGLTSHSNVGDWCRGDRFPALEQAPALAEHLGYDIANLIVAGHTFQCVVCDRTIIQTKRTSDPRYCSKGCKSLDYDRRRRAIRQESGVVAKRDLAVIQKAVAKMCRDCAPEGFCWNAKCPLQVAGVSPLKLPKGEAA